MRGTMQAIADAKESMGQIITTQGLVHRVDALQERIDELQDRMSFFINMHKNLENAFAAFQKQRAIELNRLVAGGSTTPEDMDGNND